MIQEASISDLHPLLCFIFAITFDPCHLHWRPGVMIRRKLPYFYPYERKITLCPLASVILGMHSAKATTVYRCMNYL